MRIRKLFTGAGLLSLSPLVLAGSTFLALPMIMVNLGAGVWAALVVGQAAGEVLRVIVVWGWNSLGISKVAAMPVVERYRYYFDSFAPRLLLFSAAASVALVVTAFLPGVPRFALALMILAGAVYGLASGWMLIAVDRPVALFLMDSLPRAASTLLGAVLLFLVPNAAFYSAVVLVGSIVAVVLPFLSLRGVAKRLDVHHRPQGMRAIINALIIGAPFVGVVLVMVLRMSGPVALAPALASAATPTIALADKLVRWVNTAVTPLIQSLQVRIPEGRSTLAIKARRGMVLAGALGVAVGGVAGVASYYGAPIISAGQIPLTPLQSCAIAIFSTALFAGGVVGNSVLVMLSQQRALFRASVAGLCALLVVFPLSLHVWGAEGGLFGWALSEVAVVVVQVLAVASWIKRSGRESNPGEP